MGHTIRPPANEEGLTEGDTWGILGASGCGYGHWMVSALAKQPKASRDLQMGKRKRRASVGPPEDGFRLGGVFCSPPALKAELAWSGEGQGPSSARFLLPRPAGAGGRGWGPGPRPIVLLRPAGKRWSTACAYLHPALTRTNLRAEARAFVSRVLFEGTRAVGVEYVRNGQRRRVSQLPGQGLGRGHLRGPPQL